MIAGFFHFIAEQNTALLGASVRSFKRWLTLLRFRNTARACSADRNRKATDIYLESDLEFNGDPCLYRSDLYRF